VLTVALQHTKNVSPKLESMITKLKWPLNSKDNYFMHLPYYFPFFIAIKQTECPYFKEIYHTNSQSTRNIPTPKVCTLIMRG
jgi:hypothetical protein